MLRCSEQPEIHTKESAFDVREFIARDLSENLCRLGYPAQFRPSYQDLLNRWRHRPPVIRNEEIQFQHAPDVCVEKESLRLVCCIEVGCIADMNDAQERLDRLLRAQWRLSIPSLRLTSLAALVFVEKFEAEEDMEEAERRLEEWLAANYGPFKGVDRIHLPMTPHLSYSIIRAALDRKNSWNRPITSDRWPRYVSFCIWY